MKEVKRRLAAIMFTDMVGYSAMMQRDETIAQRLRMRHRDVFKQQTAAHGGEILQYYGDGTLSVFPSATAAVECAVEMQRELRQEPVVPLRIGIHTGDISYGEEDVYGDGVNVASRIESLCVPGGIFISGKVYDDIKNHSKIRAISMGSFSLKNISNQVEIYAVTNQGLNVPDMQVLAAKVERPAAFQPIVGRKSKFRAGLLALLFGMFGIHRFYLGQRQLGLVYLGVTLSALFIFSFLNKLVPVMAVLGFVDAMILWFMSRRDFDQKYNPHWVAATEKAISKKAVGEVDFMTSQLRHFKEKAFAHFENYDYPGAINWLKKAVELKYDEPEFHFLLARMYSLHEEPEKALLHLDAAVAFGMKDLDVIKKHDDLAHLRIQPIFEAFVKNDYRLPKEMPAVKDDLLQSERTAPDLLEQLNKLQKLRNEGVLNEEEYLKLRTAAGQITPPPATS